MKVLENNKIEFADGDVVDFDSLGEIIGAWVAKFKEVHDNHPFKGVPGAYLPTTEGDVSDSDIKIGQRAYYEHLDKIIYAFSGEYPDMEEDFIQLGSDGRIEITNQAAANRYSGIVEEHDRRVDEGLELFKQLYQTLWI